MPDGREDNVVRLMVQMKHNFELAEMRCSALGPTPLAPVRTLSRAAPSGSRPVPRASKYVAAMGPSYGSVTIRMVDSEALSVHDESSQVALQVALFLTALVGRWRCPSSSRIGDLLAPVTTAASSTARQEQDDDVLASPERLAHPLDAQHQQSSGPPASRTHRSPRAPLEATFCVCCPCPLPAEVVREPHPITLAPPAGLHRQADHAGLRQQRSSNASDHHMPVVRPRGRAGG